MIDMKFGMRKPSLKKGVKARTTGRIKRKAKSTINPLHGKKGTGWVRNPKKAAYNKVYRKTSFGLLDILKKYLNKLFFTKVIALNHIFLRIVHRMS